MTNALVLTGLANFRLVGDSELGIETLVPGSWVQYAIRSRIKLDGRRERFAAAVEIFEVGYDPTTELKIEPGSFEETFLNSELPPDEPQPAAAPAPEYRSVLMLPENRTKSLRQLISERKLVA